MCFQTTAPFEGQSSPSILSPKAVSYVENQTQTEDVIWDMFLLRESQKHEKLNSLHISASDDLNCDKIQKKSKRLHILFIFASTRKEEMMGIIHYAICFQHSPKRDTLSKCTSILLVHFPHWVILLRDKQLFHSHVHTAFDVDV